jgi:hypothetical protein
VRTLNRIEVVGETPWHALSSLALVALEWLRVVSPSEWKDHYARQVEDDLMPSQPDTLLRILTLPRTRRPPESHRPGV